jgi:hypothetical protein
LYLEQIPDLGLNHNSGSLVPSLLLCWITLSCPYISNILSLFFFKHAKLFHEIFHKHCDYHLANTYSLSPLRINGIPCLTLWTWLCYGTYFDQSYVSKYEENKDLICAFFSCYCHEKNFSTIYFKTHPIRILICPFIFVCLVSLNYWGINNASI